MPTPALGKNRPNLGRLCLLPGQPIRQMHELRDTGVSLRGIAAELRAQGHQISYVAVRNALDGTKARAAASAA